jgi:hypothetical protein
MLSFLTIEAVNLYLSKDALPKKKPGMSIRHDDRAQKGTFAFSAICNKTTRP